MERYYAALRARRRRARRHGREAARRRRDGGLRRAARRRGRRDPRRARRGRDAGGVPRARRASSAALVRQIGLRVAVNTGEVVVERRARRRHRRSGERRGAPAGARRATATCVIGEATRRLVATLVTLAPLGSFALKGRAETVAAYRVVSLERPAGAAAAPFVGRDDELARLDGGVRRGGRDAGGPARRAARLARPRQVAPDRRARAPPRRRRDRPRARTATPPAAPPSRRSPQALRALLGLDDGAERRRRARGDRRRRCRRRRRRPRAASPPASPRCSPASPASPEETFFVVRRFLAALAAAQPVVLVIDDLHWAEPLLLDLVEHLVQWGSGVPLLRAGRRRDRSCATLRSSLVDARRRSSPTS